MVKSCEVDLAMRTKVDAYRLRSFDKLKQYCTARGEQDVHPILCLMIWTDLSTGDPQALVMAKGEPHFADPIEMSGVCDLVNKRPSFT